MAEMSSDAVVRLWNDQLNRRLVDLIHATTSHEKLGGITAIDYLLEVHQDNTPETKRNLFRLYNYVKTLLPCADINVMIAASKTLGSIAEYGGTSFADHFVAFEVPKAVQQLQGDKDQAKYAAVLILRELARHSPSHFFQFVPLVLDKIWIPLRDPRVKILFMINRVFVEPSILGCSP